MEAITQPFLTHIERRHKLVANQTFFRKQMPPIKKGIQRVFEVASNAQVRESIGFSVRSFRELVGCISELASSNPHLNLYYRGQGQDHNDRKQRSKIYPSLYRPRHGQSNLRSPTIRKRLASMKEALRQMRTGHGRLALPSSVLSYHDEYYQALLQHYEILPTPLVDITVSLRVAASFALCNEWQEGFLYVLNLPLPTGSISHFIDANIVLVRLQSVCPTEALRPHDQEGYLVGQLRSGEKKLVGDNLAKRMIGKYHLLNPEGEFWDSDFSPIPKNALLPEKDEFGVRLKGLLSTLERPD